MSFVGACKDLFIFGSDPSRGYRQDIGILKGARYVAYMSFIFGLMFMFRILDWWLSVAKTVPSSNPILLDLFPKQQDQIDKSSMAIFVISVELSPTFFVS